jgi:hypothetical protein
MKLAIRKGNALEEIFFPLLLSGRVMGGGNASTHEMSHVYLQEDSFQVQTDTAPHWTSPTRAAQY